MSLTGLFLISFLFVHLIGNLQLLANDGGESFNTYAYFMTQNPLIKTISYGLYFFIVLHAIQGLMIAAKNRSAKGYKYSKKTKENASWSSKNMAMLGILILAFICIHMGDFWFKMKFGSLPMKTYAGFENEVTDLYGRVMVAFQEWYIVLIYLIGLLALYFHLAHGFQSAFHTLGLNHKKYTPIIKGLGTVFSLVVSVGFAIIPIYIYINSL